MSAGRRSTAQAQEEFQHHFNLANALLNSGRPDAAVASYDQAIAARPGHAQAHFGRALALQALKQPEAALAGYDNVLALDPAHAMACYNRAMLLAELGRRREAIASYDRAIALDPHYAKAHWNKALTLLALGDLAQAWRLYECRWKPKAVPGFEYLNTPRPPYLGEGTGKRVLVWAEQGVGDEVMFGSLLGEFIRHFGDELKDFTDTAALCDLMDLVISVDTSVAHLSGALGRPTWLLLPSFPDWRWMLEREDSPWYPSMKLYRQTQENQWRDVFARVRADLVAHVAHFAQASADTAPPRDTKDLHRQGVLAMQRGDYAAAVAVIDQALALRPDDAPAHLLRADALFKLGRHEDACVGYEQAIRLRPDCAPAHGGLGNALQAQKKIDAAIGSYDRAIALAPGTAWCHNNRGLALQQRNELAAAIVAYSQAIALDPTDASAHWHKAMALVKAGDFEQGWKLFEWRWKLSSDSTKNWPARQPLWLGKPPLRGRTILLHHEQGAGDTLQFCRYVPLVARAGARVLLAVPRPLASLMRSLEGVDAVIEPGAAVPAFDLHCPLLSLPLAFNTTLATVPLAQGYLRADPDKVAQWERSLGARRRPRVGLVWNGGFRADRPELWDVNERRNLPVRLLQALRDVDCDFISLQKGDPAESELKQLQQQGWDGPQMLNRVDELKDFSDTAALIAALDLVIAVDTSVAHLAGALGKPVWLLNRFESCWRWLVGREDSPWYRSMRIFNQTRMGDWEGVMAEVVSALKAPGQTPQRHADAVPRQQQNDTALFKQGLALHQQGQLEQAKAIYEQILTGQPRHFDALHLLGTIAAQTGNPSLAAEWIGKAIEANPNNADAHFNLGIALKDLQRTDEALASYDRAIELRPDFADAYYSRGNALKWLIRLEEAVASYDRAIELKPDYWDAHSNRGNVLKGLTRLEEAVASYDRAIELKPDFAQTHWNKSLALLALGDLAQAWRLYDWRMKPNAAPGFKYLATPKPPYQGEGTGKRVLVWAEQGVGDEVMFGSLLGEFSRQCASLLVRMDARLIPLFARALPQVRFYPSGQDVPPDSYDEHIAMGSLCQYLRNTPESFRPTEQGYLAADPARARALRQSLLGGEDVKLCGISWRSSNAKTGPDRSLTLANFVTQLSLPGYRFVNLQYGDTQAEIAQVAQEQGIEVLQCPQVDNLKDLDGLAALIEACDLVVCVDNSTAHLAGALGKDVRVLLPEYAEWRWMMGGDKSLWYASARLYRQSRRGDWAGVLDRVTQALRGQTDGV